MSAVAAIVLAAGASRRFRAANPGVSTKLVAEFGGTPLVRHVAAAATASRARPVVVVTGHAREEVEAALRDMDVAFVHNADFGGGLSGSLRAGLNALPEGVPAAIVLLGDMPLVGPDLIDRLIAAHAAAADIDAVVPVHQGRRANPVLLGRPLFRAAMRLDGDEGARRLLARARVLEVDVADKAVALDVDDPEALRALGGG